MQKRTIKITVAITILGIIAFLGYKIVSQTQEKNAIANHIQTIPEFRLQTLNNTPFTKASLKNKPVVFLYFNSECDYCHHEAQSISNNSNKLNNVQLIFVSIEPVKKIKAFSERYDLHKHPGITFLYDSADSFSKQFYVPSVPYVLIYDKEQNLIKTHAGQLKAEGIIKALNK